MEEKTVGLDERKTVVTKFWDLFDRKKFLEAKEFLHSEFTAIWPTSKEKFLSRDLFIQMNIDYPGDWRTELQIFYELGDDKAVSTVFVYSHTEKGEFFVNTFYKFKEGLISEIVEYWSDVSERPAWRDKFSEKL